MGHWKIIRLPPYGFLVDERPKKSLISKDLFQQKFMLHRMMSLWKIMKVADFAIERARRLVEIGKDVILLIDQ